MTELIVTGLPKCKKLMKTVWKATWDKELTQKRIQGWIERMPRHIKEVIRLEGGNEYREGREDGPEGKSTPNAEGVVSDIRPYNSKARIETYNRRAAGIRAGDADDWEDC